MCGDQRPRFVERLADAIATRHLAHTRATGIVAQDDNVAGKQRAVRATQVEQHAVFPGNRDNQHLRDDRCALAQIGHG